ncbi:MAG: aminotransferase class IV [Phycisphaerales bacterium]|nr:aminotransferase class IV [Phycisphaerales bacterium]
MDVWLNGEVVPESEAHISVFDSGLQHAVGVFETMTARNARIFRVEQHMERLVDSAKTLLMSNRLQARPLAEAAERLLAHNAMAEARVRLTVTGGNLNMLQASEDGHVDPTVLVVAQPPTPYPPAFFSQGVEVSLAPGRANPWTPMAGHKTLDYWNRIHALQLAGLMGASEAIWLDPSANLASGCVSNIFIVRDGVLQTPLARGDEEEGAETPAVLPGITRAAVMECAQEAGMPVEIMNLEPKDLLSADEAFLTNSSWQILPVRGIRFRTRSEEGEEGMETRQIADGSVGTATSRLRRSLLELIERETRDDPIS